MIWNQSSRLVGYGWTRSLEGHFFWGGTSLGPKGFMEDSVPSSILPRCLRVRSDNGWGGCDHTLEYLNSEII